MKLLGGCYFVFATGMGENNFGGGIKAPRLAARATPGGGPVWWPDPRGVGSVC